MLADAGFSTALFAPAWTFEHFATTPSSEASDPQGPRSIAKAVDLGMWEGVSLPENLKCDCREGKPHHTSQYRQNPIVDNATEYAAGSSTYFYTDFTRAFNQDSHGWRSRLGSQAILPHLLLPMSAPAWEAVENDRLEQLIRGKYADDGLSIHIWPTRRSEKSANHDPVAASSYDSSNFFPSRLCLFKVNMKGDGSLHAIIGHVNARRRSCTLGVYTAYQSANAKRLEYKYHHLSLVRDANAVVTGNRELEGTTTVHLWAEGAEARLVEVGIFCQETIYTQESKQILHLKSFLIKPWRDEHQYFTIKDIRTIQRGQVPNVETRLSWAWGFGNAQRLPGLPWSATTGPFSHFTVIIDGQELGSAYCLEFPVLVEDCCGSDEVQVLIVGHVFGGGTASSPMATMVRRDVLLTVMDESRSVKSDPD